MRGSGRSESRQASRPTAFDHGLGALFTDYDGDGRADLYVANDLDPNRLYRNVPWPGGATRTLPASASGSSSAARAMASPTGTPAWASPRATSTPTDGRTSSSRTPTGSCTASSRAGVRDASRTRGRASRGAFDTTLAGWGVSWVDLDLDGDLDLVVANGAIPVTDLTRDAEPVQVFESGRAGRFDERERLCRDRDGPVRERPRSRGGRLRQRRRRGPGDQLDRRPARAPPERPARPGTGSR